MEPVNNTYCCPSPDCSGILFPDGKKRGEKKIQRKAGSRLQMAVGFWLLASGFWLLWIKLDDS